METYGLILAISGVLNLITFIWLLVVGFKRSVVWGILIFLFSPLSAIIFAILNWFDAKKAFLAYLVTGLVFVAALVMFMNEYGEDLQEINQAMEEGRIKPNEAAQFIGKTDQLPGNEPVVAEEDLVINDEIAESAPVTTDSSDTSSDASEAGSTEDQTESVIASDAEQTEEKIEEAVVEETKPSPYPSLHNVKPDPLASKKKVEPKVTTRVGVNKLSNYIGRYFEVTKKNGTKHRGILTKVTKSRIILDRKIYNGNFTYRIRKTDIKRADMFKKEYVEEFQDK